jgi:hypothetical protein
LTGILIAGVLSLAFLPGKVINRGSYNYADYHSQSEWERGRIDANAANRLGWIALAFACSLLLGIVVYVATALVIRLRHRPLAPWTRCISRPLRWATLIAAFSGMWLSLVWFVQFQTHMNSLAGEENRDTEWSFRQILAVATWVSVIAEFEYLLLKSPTNALNGRLMDPYAVTEVSRTTEGFEMTHGRDSAYLAL